LCPGTKVAYLVVPFALPILSFTTSPDKILSKLHKCDRPLTSSWTVLSDVPALFTLNEVNAQLPPLPSTQDNESVVNKLCQPELKPKIVVMGRIALMLARARGLNFGRISELLAINEALMSRTEELVSVKGKLLSSTGELLSSIGTIGAPLALLSIRETLESGIIVFASLREALEPTDSAFASIIVELSSAAGMFALIIDVFRSRDWRLVSSIKVLASIKDLFKSTMGALASIACTWYKITTKNIAKSTVLNFAIKNHPYRFILPSILVTKKQN